MGVEVVDRIAHRLVVATEVDRDLGGSDTAGTRQEQRHYIRITPADPADSQPNEDPDAGVLRIANRGPQHLSEFPAREIVDAGFLELVSYGIRKPSDALIEDSLQVVDAVRRIETPYGPSWRRYTHDGYGQRPDGGPFEGWGTGRAWPLLTGERGHYELSAGRAVAPFIEAMERFTVQMAGAFCLRWTHSEWQSATETRSTPTALGIEFVDIPIEVGQQAPIRFTFRWIADDHWEGTDYVVHVDGAARR
ncbi:MAG: hypothetical protein U0768_19410 [Anaerolineae bacterium]